MVCGTGTWQHKFFVLSNKLEYLHSIVLEIRRAYQIPVPVSKAPSGLCGRLSAMLPGYILKRISSFRHSPLLALLFKTGPVTLAIVVIDAQIEGSVLLTFNGSSCCRTN